MICRMFQFVSWLFRFGPDEDQEEDEVVQFEPLPDVGTLRQLGRTLSGNGRGRRVRVPTPPLIDFKGPVSPMTSTPRHGSSPIPFIDLTVTLLIIMTLSCGGPFIVVTSVESTIKAIPHNGTMHLADRGKVVFFTKSAVLHLEVDPFLFYDRVKDAIQNFISTSRLTNQERLLKPCLCSRY